MARLAREFPNPPFVGSMRNGANKREIEKLGTDLAAELRDVRTDLTADVKEIRADVKGSQLSQKRDRG
ncbi:hypothetical protein RUND412_009264 [Rhizina undulata]